MRKVIIIIFLLVTALIRLQGQPAAPTVGDITQPTCTVSTGSVVLSGLPEESWTITPGDITGTETSTTISGLEPGTYNFIVTTTADPLNPSDPSSDVVINAQPSTPTAPVVGTITQPSCTVATGSVALSGLPPSGTWTLERWPGGTITGSGTSTTISGLSVGTYYFTVTDASGCASPGSADVIINAQPLAPTAPTVGTITQPTCSVATGSVVLNGLPSGSWTINPGSITGSGSSRTISGLDEGTYNYTVTDASGCTSPASANVVINTQPSAPTAPVVGTITQPSCTVATGSVVLSGLPASGTWTLERWPGGTITGSGTSTTISGLAVGTYYYTVTNASGCSSPASANVVINPQPSTPTAPTVGTRTQPTCSLATGSVVLNGLPGGSWTINPGSITGSGTSTTISGLAMGTYNFTVTNASGCTSPASANVVINAQPLAPTAPAVGTITQPTCSVATGSVVLNGLPSGSWTINPGSITGSGTSRTISGLDEGTYNYTVTDASGCTSPASANVVINTQPSTPTAPVVGTITQPTCTVATGSVVLSGLPASGTWTLERWPGGTITGSGTSTTILGLAVGTYYYTVTNASGCLSVASDNIVINTQPVTSTAPIVGTITHPTCEVGTGSVILSGLPSSGTWTLTRTPGATTTSGTGASITVTGIPSGTYNFTVTNASGCTSTTSANVVINVTPITPTVPAIGTITQPTCTIATGNVVLNGLPATGTWTLTLSPDGTVTSGTGTTTTISGLDAGTYAFTVTIESGCTSAASGNVVINTQPSTPTVPVVGTITQPTCTIATGSVVLDGLPATGTWTLTRTPGGTTTTGSGTSTTISGLAAGTYTYIATNESGCSSTASDNIVINAQPPTPTAPTVGTRTHPTCSIATGSVVLNGLPATDTWTLTRTPGGTTSSGTGTSTTVTGIPSGSYTFTVTNTSGCTSSASGNAVINAQPPTPTAPVIGTITQPTLSVLTGSVVLSGLPATGAWSLTRTPGGTITSGTGISTTISGLAPGTYTFTVTNAYGCTSLASANVGLYTLKLYGPDQKILHSNDIIKLNNSDAGSFSISVESNTDWSVSENSLWLKAVKESGSSKITVTYLENISTKDKVAAVRVAYSLNPDFVINFQQKARVSKLDNSKFENVKIYPNPANDFVYLNFGEEEFEKILISITNIQGFTMSLEEYSDITSNQIIGLNISVLPVGQYLINIGDGIQSKSFHLIKY